MGGFVGLTRLRLQVDRRRTAGLGVVEMAEIESFGLADACSRLHQLVHPFGSIRRWWFSMLIESGEERSRMGWMLWGKAKSGDEDRKTFLAEGGVSAGFSARRGGRRSIDRPGEVPYKQIRAKYIKYE
jgi:hypothetical protein